MNEVIEEVVTFENGGLNTSVDAMVEVINEKFLSNCDMFCLEVFLFLVCVLSIYVCVYVCISPARCLTDCHSYCVVLSLSLPAFFLVCLRVTLTFFLPVCVY